MWTRDILFLVAGPGHETVKYFNKIWQFQKFLKWFCLTKTFLKHLFSSKNS